jgi:hypothetical protein
MPVSVRKAAHSMLRPLVPRIRQSVAMRSNRGSGLSPCCFNHPKSWVRGRDVSTCAVLNSARSDSAVISPSRGIER